MQDFLFVKVENFYIKLKFSEIFYIQAEKKYVIIATAADVYISLVSIGQIEKILPKHLFCRIHRSYIISLENVEKFDNEIAYVGNKILPIAKQFRTSLKSSVTIISGEVRSFRLEDGQVDKLLQQINSKKDLTDIGMLRT